MNLGIKNLKRLEKILTDIENLEEKWENGEVTADYVLLILDELSTLENHLRLKVHRKIAKDSRYDSYKNFSGNDKK